MKLLLSFLLVLSALCANDEIKIGVFAYLGGREDGAKI